MHVLGASNKEQRSEWYVFFLLKTAKARISIFPMSTDSLLNYFYAKHHTNT